jgi:hypothetical protein
MARDTGNGASLAFTTGTFSARVKSINLGDKSRESLEDSGLDTTNYKEMVPGDLWTHSPITVGYFADPSVNNAWAPPEAVDTLTITFSNQGAANAATYAATGFVTQITLPTLVNDALMEGEFQFTPDGKSTEPTFTRDAT